MSKELEEKVWADGFVDGWWVGRFGHESKEEDYRQYHDSALRQQYLVGYREGLERGKRQKRENDLMNFRRERDDKHQKRGRIR